MKYSCSVCGALPGSLREGVIQTEVVGSSIDKPACRLHVAEFINGSQT